MDVRVWFVCCCKKMVCVLVIYGREKLHGKSQIQPLWAPVEFCWHLIGEIWYCAQHFFYWKHIFCEILKFGTQLVEIYDLKFNIFHKIYILYKIFITHFHKLELFWFNFLNLFLYFNNNLPWFFFKTRPNLTLCSQASHFYARLVGLNEFGK